MTKAQGKKIKKKLRELVKLRDGDGCAKCGKQGVLHLSHIIPISGCKMLEFYHRNVKLLCVRHHLYWWHRDPREAARWFMEHFGVEWGIELDTLKSRIIANPKKFKHMRDYEYINNQIDTEIERLKKHDIWV